MTIEMREPTFWILSVLADGPHHGYTIIREADVLSEGAVRLRAGTLYAALERLRGDGLVAIAGEEVVQGRMRRSFELTDDGRARLIEAARRRREASNRAFARLGLAAVAP